MPNGQTITEKEITNAIDYIKHSNIFVNSRYEWVTPLINRVLEDNLCDADINDLVDSFLLKKEVKNEQVVSEQAIPKAVKDDGSEDSVVNIKKIKSIDKILNIGLLDIKDPISLKDGLNVFYGKNGAGKSSIYLGLCKVLGKNKRIYSNTENQSNESSSQITFKGSDDNDYILKWDSSFESEESKVMIFDNLISNYLVDQDQENHFKMAHLKMEYFSLLYDLYQKIEDKLTFELNKINTEFSALGQVLVGKISTVLNNFNWDEEKIKKLNFTKEEEEKLKDINYQIKVLEKDNPDAVVKNIGTALEESEGVLSVFGAVDEKTGNYVLSYNKLYFEKVNEQIEKYNKVKEAFEESGKNKISSLIPPEWINNNIWEAFISSSIGFLNSLKGEESERYSSKICIYCHQSLQTKEAKALIKAYQELHKEHKEKLDEELNKLKKITSSINGCIKVIGNISEINIKVEKEFETINKKNHISFDFENLKNILKKYETAISEAHKIEIDDKDIKAIDDFWSIYKSLSDDFNIVITRLKKDITDKDGKIKKLEGELSLLKEKKILYESKGDLFIYLKLNESKKILSNKISIIAPLRQATSSLKSAFADDATLKEFKKYLKKEYDGFNFSPPETWNITPTTRGGVNKRVYSIRERRLAEIFSEGEKKLHALSDFFAQCELDKYKGVFIFDDPVNSLDEDNIEAVAERIIKLVEDGNQAIVFTHNLYFLNSVINSQKEKITKVERVNNQINLFREIMIGETQELKERLNEINLRMDEFSKIQPEEVKEYDMRSIYDLMSGYLEDYVEKVYFKNVISRYRPNIRMASLSELKDIDTSVFENILKLYERTSRRGARHSQPGSVKKPSYLELVEDVKNLKDNYRLK